MADLVFSRLPVDGPITGSFAEVYKRDDGTTYKHRGVDFGVNVGTSVFAPAAGNVVAFTNDGSFGTGICLDHTGTPWFSLYAHLSEARVKVGDTVTAGQLLGLSGATGEVTGPHLHWQLCKSTGFPVDITQSADPMSFVSTGAAAVARSASSSDLRATTAPRIYPPAVEQWRPLVAKYFPGSMIGKALWVIQFESSGDPACVGDNGRARSLFQIHDVTSIPGRPTAAFLDIPENNISFAAGLVGADGKGWSNWGENALFEGKVFGALGNHPYPGDPPLELADIVAFLGVDGAVRAWNARGNSLAAGYAGLQSTLQGLANRVALLAGEPDGQVRADLVRELRELATELEARGQPSP